MKSLLKSVITIISPFLTVFTLSGLLTVNPSLAQSITSGDNNTVVNQNGNTYNIEGGIQSGANLFHTLQKLGLSEGEIANFLSSPQIQNILTRVVGGDASIINGLIQVLGGNSNLFIMNPAGMIFGPNASLNVPADFTATTATGIGFDGGWFNAFGTNDYQSLVGNPHSFAFDLAQPGVIINAGDLAVGEGQSLSLVAGNVINTGTLTAKSGDITMVAVPGSNTVIISREGHLLSIEIKLPRNLNGEVIPITATDLPDLLTTGVASNVETGLSVDSQGTVSLTDSGTILPDVTGMAIASGKIDVSSNFVPSDSLNISGYVGGNVNIVGEKVGVINGDIQAWGINGGGNVRIGGGFQGNGNIPNAKRTFVGENAVINADAITQGDGGTIIVWGDEVTGFYGDITAKGGLNWGDGGFVEVSGKQGLIFDGKVDVSAINGEFGTLLLDPINITISFAPSTEGVDDSFTDDDETNGIFDDDFVGQNININSVVLGSQTANITLQADNDITFNAPVNITSSGLDLTAQAGNNINVNANIATTGGDINLTSINGNIITTTAGRLSTNDISGGGDVTLTAMNGEIKTTRISTISLRTDDGDVGNGGNVAFTARNNITVSNGAIDTSTQLGGQGNAGDGGSINLVSTEGSIEVEDLISSSRVGSTANDLGNSGDGGDITLNAGGSISVNPVTTGVTASTSNSGIGTAGEGGNISFTADGDVEVNGTVSTSGALGSASGNIEITSTSGEIILTGAELVTRSQTGQSGDITLISDGDLTTGLGFTIETLDAGSADGTGGNISLTSTNGNIDTTAGVINTSGITGGGDVSLTATNGKIDTARITTIASRTSDGDVGDGGNVSLTARNEINVVNADIDASAQVIAQGNAGNSGTITLDAGGNINVNNLISRSRVGNVADDIGNSGDSGDITLNARGGSINVNGAILTNPANQGTGTSGNGGDVTLSADGNIIVDLDISTRVGTSGGNGGNVTLTSTNGEIDVQSILTRSESAQSGNINLSAGEDLTTVTLDAASTDGTGGNISLNSSNGDISTTLLDTRGISEGGDITVTSSNGNIDIVDIRTSASRTDDGDLGNAGDVSLEAGGNIDIDGDIISWSSLSGQGTAGDGGNITFTAGENISVGGTIYSTSTVSGDGTAGDSGDITLEATSGNINTGQLQAQSTVTTGNAGNGGNITLIAGNEINTDRISTETQTGNGDGNVGEGGNVLLNAGTDINLNDTDIVTQTRINGNGTATGGGDITLEAEGNINVIQLSAGSIVTGNGNSGNGGNVQVTAGNEININQIDTTTDTVGNGTNLTAGEGGNITFEAGTNINIAGNTTSGSELTGSGTTGKGGNITFTAGNNINTSDINSRNVIRINNDGTDANGTSGDGGSITFNADGNIEVNGGITAISSVTTPSDSGQSTSGNGGEVFLKAGNDLSITNNVFTQAQINGDGTAGDGGNITLEATIGNINFEGLEAISQVNGIGNSGNGGNIELTGNEINWTNTVSGENNLILQPTEPTQAITIGGVDNNDPNTLNLTTQEIGLLQNNFTSITIGRDNSSSAISLTDNVTFNDPVTLRSPSTGGSITQNAGSSLNIGNDLLTLNTAGDITLNSANNDFSTVTITNGQNVTLNDVNNLDLDNINNSGNLTITTQGNQTYNNVITLNDDTFLTGTSLNINQEIDGNNQNLTLNFTESVNVSNDSLTNLNNFTNNGSSLITGDFTTIGSQTYNGVTTLNNETTLTGDTLNIDQGIDGNNQNLTLEFTNPVEVSNDTISNLNNFTNQGETSITGDFTTVGSQTYNGVTTLNNDATLTGDTLNISQGIEGNNQSLTLTFTNLVEVSNDTLSNLNNFTNNGSTSITGDFTTIGSQTYNGTTTLNNETTLTGDTLNIDQGIDGNNQNLTLEFTNPVEVSNDTISNLNNFTNQGETSITGDFTTVGSQTYNGVTTLNNEATLTGTSLNIDQGIDGNNQNLTLLFTNPVEVSNDTISNLNNFTNQGETSITGDFTTVGSQTYNEVTTLNNDATLTGTSLNINQGIDGNNQNLTLNFTDSVNVSDAIFTNINNFTIDGTGGTNLTGDLTTTGTITLDSSVTVSENSIIESTAGELVINAPITAINDASITLNGNQNITTENITTNGQPLTLNSTNGNIETGDLDTSGINGGGHITATASSGEIEVESITTTNGDISLTGNEINFVNAISGNGNLILQPTDTTQAIIIGGIDSSEANVFNLTSQELESIEDNFTSIIIGREDSSGTISLIDNITFNNPVTLRSPSTGGSISQQEGSSLNVSNDLLTLNTAGDITLNSANNDFSTVSIINGQNVTLNDSNDLDLDNINNSGDLTITTTQGSQTYNDTITLNGETILTGDTLNIPEGINGNDQNLTLNFTTSVEISNETISGLNNFTNQGATSIIGDFTTRGSQIYNDTVEIQESITLSSTNSEINFNSTVNSQAGETNNLTVNTGSGNTNFNDSIGKITPLGDLAVISSGTTIFNGNVEANSVITDAVGATQINGGTVTTTGSQTYNDAVEIQDSITLSTTNNDINFNSIVNSQVGETNNLTVNTGSGDITFNLVGNSQPLGDIQINNTANTFINNNVNALSFSTNQDGVIQISADVNTTNNQNYQNNIVLNNEVNLISNNDNGSIDVNNIDGNQQLSLTATTINLNGNIGENVALTGLTFNSDNQININNNLNIDNGDLIFNNPVNISNNVTLDVGNGIISFSENVNVNSDTVTLKANEQINFPSDASVISSGGELVIIPSNQSQNIAIVPSDTINNENTLDIINPQSINGFSLITIGTIGEENQTGEISFSQGESRFLDPANFNAININVDGAIIGGDDATLSFNGTNNINLNNNLITEENAITVDGNINLGNDVTLDTTNNGLTSAGANITINDSIDNNQNLNLRAGEGIIQLGEIGAINPVNQLTIESGSDSIFNGDINLDSTLLIQTPVTISNSNGETTTTINAEEIIINEQITSNNSLEIITNQGINLAEGIVTNGNDISLSSQNSGIETGILDSSSISEDGEVNGGAIALTAPGAINTGDINSSSTNGSGGNILINGNVIETGILNSSSQSGDGGAIALTAPVDINTGEINSSSANGSGGDVTITSENGAINTGNINSSGISGGDVFIDARISISALEINASGNEGDGGNVTLDPEGDIEVGYINAQGGINGVGGDVKIETDGFFRATDSFVDQNGDQTSISTVGGIDGGTIDISYRGDEPTLFTVGDASENGTVQAISAGGDNIINPVQSLSGINLDKITITSQLEIPITSVPEVIEVIEQEAKVIQEQEPTNINDNQNDSEPVKPKIDSFSSVDAIPITLLSDAVMGVDQIFSNTVEIYFNGDVVTTSPSSIPEQGNGGNNRTEQKNKKENGGPTPTDPEPVDPVDSDEKPETITDIKNILRDINNKFENNVNQNVNPAIIYVAAERRLIDIDPNVIDPNIRNKLKEMKRKDNLVIILVTKDGQRMEFPVYIDDKGKQKNVTFGQVLEIAENGELKQELTNGPEFRKREGATELKPENLERVRKLYDWIIRPLEETLKEQDINNLVFIMDVGLRSLPIAVLSYKEGKKNKYLVEKYSVGLMPSVSLTLKNKKDNHVDIRNAKLLATGSSNFVNQGKVPEISTKEKQFQIIKNTRKNVTIIEKDKDFTLDNLNFYLGKDSYNILHIISHAKFEKELLESYLRLYDQELKLNQINDISFVSSNENQSNINLLVLSACETALGNEYAELGFAGLAYKAKVSTVVAGLWSVSEEGTLKLMERFYHHLKEVPIKAEALQQAQIDMIDAKNKYSHPYYWAGFTVVGNPW